MSEWKPIKSAPKDRHVLVARFAPNPPEYDGLMHVQFWDKEIGGWGKFNAAYWPATHWHELPEPPK